MCLWHKICLLMNVVVLNRNRYCLVYVFYFCIRVFWLFLHLCVNGSLLIQFKQELVGKGITLDGELKPVYLHNISADNELGDLNLSSKLNTSWDFMMYLKNLGYKACDAWLGENYEHIGKQNTLKLV